MATPVRKRRRSAPQKRGQVRRKLLLDAARLALDQLPLEDVTLANVSESAGIPIGSTYHFFNNISAVHVALAQQYGEEVLDVLRNVSYKIGPGDNWESIIHQAIDAVRDYLDENPCFRQLIFSGKTPPQIKLADRENDEVIGQLLIDLIGRHFVLPDLVRVNEIFFYMVEITDLFWMLSIIRHGEITDEMIEEMKLAACAYLRSYLPRELAPRTPAADEN